MDEALRSIYNTKNIKINNARTRALTRETMYHGSQTGSDTDRPPKIIPKL